MKKVFFLLIVLVIVSVSCDKADKVVELQENNMIKNVAPSANAADRTYYDNGGTDYGCKSPAANCYPTAIITSEPDQDVIEYVFEVVEAGNNNDIITVFTDEYDVLVNYVPSVFVDGVINGDYLASSRGDSFEVAKYLVFNEDDKVIGVSPISFE